MAEQVSPLSLIFSPFSDPSGTGLKIGPPRAPTQLRSHSPLLTSSPTWIWFPHGIYAHARFSFSIVSFRETRTSSFIFFSLPQSLPWCVINVYWVDTDFLKRMKDSPKSTKGRRLGECWHFYSAWVMSIPMTGGFPFSLPSTFLFPGLCPRCMLVKIMKMLTGCIIDRISGREETILRGPSSAFKGTSPRPLVQGPRCKAGWVLDRLQRHMLSVVLWNSVWNQYPSHRTWRRTGGLQGCFWHFKSVVPVPRGGQASCKPNVVLGGREPELFSLGFLE